MNGTLSLKWRILNWTAGRVTRPTEVLGAVKAREAMRASTSGAAFILGTPARLARVSDETLAGVSVRSYEPDAAQAGVLVYFHGGGWVVGDRDSHDVPCRALAAATRRRVVSVDYRLAPEHPFPAAIDDCLAVTRSLAQSARVVVAGDSAGGQLATVVARRCTVDGTPVAAQLLIYPVTDASKESDSYRRFGSGFFLTAATMRYFIEQFLPNPAQRSDPDASPLLAPPTKLPPAYVLLAECDVLRDEGVAYAERMRGAGTDVMVDEVPGVIHGFFNFQGIAEGQAAVRRLAGFVDRVLGG
jgi:acetyl esterase